MEVRSLDLLRFHLAAGDDPEDAFRHCISHAQQRFEELTVAYLGALADFVVPAGLRDRFALLGVGTMGDRDDIDVAAVDDLGSEGRAELNPVLSRLAQIMLRTSCTLHYHMAEALDLGSFSASIDDYTVALAGRPYSPVVISQLVCATPLIGSGTLSADFLREVPTRYHHHPGRPNPDHEGFLRAMLGEIRELIQRRVSASYINPKKDGLRLIKGYLALSKSVHHIPSRGWTGILDFLMRRSARHRDDFRLMDRALTFLETVRYLYQLLVVEEEEIATTGGDEGVLTVAERMGFSQRGSLSADVPFVSAYYDLVGELKRGVGRLLDPLVEHLGLVSTLSVFAFETGHRPAAGNLAVRHAVEARRFFGCRYFDDLLEVLEREDSPASQRFIGDLEALSASRRRVVLSTFVEWGLNDVATFGRFLILLHGRAQRELFVEALTLFLERCREEPAVVDRLAALHALWPGEVQRFVTVLDRPSLAQVHSIVGSGVQRQELVAAHTALVRLVELHQHASDWFLDRFRAAVERQPRVLKLLLRPDELRLLADTLYGQSERFADLYGRREWLGGFHDLTTVSLGLEFFAGGSCRQIVRRHRQSMHILMRSLFFLCRRELYTLYRREWTQRHSMAILIDEGCTAFQPFDPQVRLLVLLYQTDDDIKLVSREIVATYVNELGGLGIEVVPFVGDGALAPAVPAAHFAALEGLDPLSRLEILRLRKLVGTHGHMRQYTESVVEPLLAPIRGELSELLREWVGTLAAAVGDGVDRPDPVLMPGGVNDVQRLLLFGCATGGGTSLCDEQPACAADGPGPMAQLSRNLERLQVVAALRRLVHDPHAATSDQGLILARHQGLGGRLVEDPDAALAEIAAENVALMQELVR
jgi:hypothetical protein